MEQEQQKRPAGRKMKISRVSIVDQVCDSIKQDIADGIWKAGDRLPSEAEFAETFGVNRLSVRMALQKLSTLGIIETRVGEGSFVCSFSLKPVLSEISIFYEGADQYHDIQQLRNLLEYECMRLAAHTASEQEKAELKEALDHYYELNRNYFELGPDNEEALELVKAEAKAEKPKKTAAKKAEKTEEGEAPAEEAPKKRATRSRKGTPTPAETASEQE